MICSVLKISENVSKELLDQLGLSVYEGQS